LAHENPGPVRDAILPIIKLSMTRTAGEVRHVKDRAGDEKNFAWADHGPNEREMVGAFEFDASKLKPLAKCLRATLMALGHSQSAYHDFTKLKSAVISPDGNLGGKGYIQRIAEMRRMYMNVSEALSALSDTIYDEINAAHWNPQASEEDPRERTDVAEIMDDVDEIREDPEGFAEEIEEDMEEHHGHGKTAAVPASVGKAAKEVGKAVGMMDRAAKILTGDRRSSVAVHEAWISVNHAAEVVANVHAEILDMAEGKSASVVRVATRSKTSVSGADPDLDAKAKAAQVKQILSALKLLSHHKIKPKVETDPDGWSMISLTASTSMSAAYIEEHLDQQLGSRTPFEVESGGSKVYITVGEDERNRRARTRRTVGQRSVK